MSALPLHADVWLSISRECNLWTAMRLYAICRQLQKRLSGRWLDCHDMQCWRERVCKMAAKANRLDLVQACIERGAIDLGSAMECAMRAMQHDPPAVHAVQLFHVWWRQTCNLIEPSGHYGDGGHYGDRVDSYDGQVYLARRFIIQAMSTAAECDSACFMNLFKSLKNSDDSDDMGDIRRHFSLEVHSHRIYEAVGKSGNLALMRALHDEWCHPNRSYFKNFAIGASLADFQQLHDILNACVRCKPR